MKGIIPFIGGTSLKSSLLPILALVTFGITSCMPDNSQPLPGAGVVGEAITLSETDLTFSQDGGAQEVTVEGTENWNFISNVGEKGWLKLSQDGNTLSIIVEANPGGDERTATVLVTGPTSQAKLNIVQTQADFVIDFTDAEVIIPAMGGEKVVLFKANTSEYTIDPVPAEVDWLTVTEGTGAVVLNALENTSNEARVANLTISSVNGEKRALTVTQLGVQKYFIPYEVTDIENYNPMQIIRFEEARGNLIVGFSEPQEVEAYFPGSGLWQFQPGVINVVTGSRTSNVIVYNYATLESADTGYTDAQIPVYYSDETTKPEKAEYVSYLEENGFKAEDESGITYLNGSGKLRVALDETQEGGLIAKFTPNFEQPEPYPTWETMPIGTIHENLDFMRNPDVKAAQIREMETAAGSELIADQESAIAAATGGTGLDEGYRFYFFGMANNVGSIGGGEELIGSVIQYDLFFDNPHYALWLAGAEWQVTNEFADLLEKEGWSYLGVNQGFIQYYKDINEELTYVMLLSVTEDQMVFEGKPALRLSRIIYPNSQVGSVSNYTLREIFEGKAGNINEALQSPLQKGVWEVFTQNNLKIFKK